MLAPCGKNLLRFHSVCFMVGAGSQYYRPLLFPLLEGIMSRSPSFQFYPADYLADANVQLMTCEEEGVYIRLLCYCWREGSLPNDDKELSALAKGVDMSRVTRVKTRFVTDPEDSQKLVHPRLIEERKKQAVYRKEWRKRQKKHRVTGKQCHANVTRESRPSSVFSLQSSSSLLKDKKEGPPNPKPPTPEEWEKTIEEFRRKNGNRKEIAM